MRVKWLMRNIPFDANDENEFGLGRYVVAAILLTQACKADLLTLCIAILFDVGFGTLEDDTAFLFSGL